MRDSKLNAYEAPELEQIRLDLENTVLVNSPIDAGGGGEEGGGDDV